MALLKYLCFTAVLMTGFSTKAATIPLDPNPVSIFDQTVSVDTHLPKGSPSSACFAQLSKNSREVVASIKKARLYQVLKSMNYRMAISTEVDPKSPSTTTVYMSLLSPDFFDSPDKAYMIKIADLHDVLAKDKKTTVCSSSTEALTSQVLKAVSDDVIDSAALHFHILELAKQERYTNGPPPITIEIKNKAAPPVAPSTSSI